jgi:predicted DNA-binding transcriptional regulator YafY
MPAGRDQVKAMGRLARILYVLDNARKVGVTADKLVAVAEYGGDDKNKQDQLSLDLRNLRKQGWQIDNVQGVGEGARYRMISGDNRLRVLLSDEQQAALQRAVILVERSDLASRLGTKPADLPEGIGVRDVDHEESDALAKCHAAVQRRSRITFTYKGTSRTVHPASVRFQNYRWYLSGQEEASELVKHYVVADMAGVSLDHPGSATAVPPVGRIPLHPLLWDVDEPTSVTVRTTRSYVPDVVRWLRDPESVKETGDVVDMRYTVTHRAAFRARVYALGSRVQHVDGGVVRDELVSELREMTGA